MALQYKSVEFSDFSGGITDNTVDGPINKYEKAENLVITKNRKLRLAPGSAVYSSTAYQIPTGAERVNALIVHEDTLFHTALTQISYTGASTNSNLLGYTSNTGFDVGAETDKVSWATWNKHLILTNAGFPNIVKVYKDSGSTWRLVTAGLPALGNSPTCTPTGGANTYIYAFAYYRSYTIGQNTFEDYGPVTEVTVSSAAAPNSNQIAITSIPVIANSTTGNYDTSNTKVRIYRTIASGTTFYYVGEVTNGTTTYNDTTADTTIDDNATIYTTGDVVENDPPPKAKYVHVDTSGICWYGHVKEGSVVSPNKIRQSIPNDPDSCPEDFYDELEDEITGLSSVQGTLIALCKNSIYRVEGFFDELGRGGIVHNKISDTVGCISHNSVVQYNNLLFFAGTDGFYYTDGYNVNKLTSDLSVTYRGLTEEAQQKLNIYGALDKLNNRIWWACQQNTSNADNDSVFVLDLNFGIENGGTFTTIGNSNSFIPTSLVFFNNEMIRGDSRGYILKHDDDIYTNPKIDESSTPTDWTTEAILYDYRSIHTSFEGTSLRKWVPGLTVNLENESNIAVQIISDNDKGRQLQELALLKYNDNIVWGDPLIVWGTTSCTWGTAGIIEQKKRFVASGIRCNYKQIRMSNGYAVIQSSDNYGEGTVNGTANTITLNSAATYDWDGDPVDYKLSFDNDVYVKEYPVTERTSADVLTFLDITGSAPTDANAEWLLKGYKKGEIFHLLSFTIQYALVSRSQRPYRSTDLGDNG